MFFTDYMQPSRGHTWVTVTTTTATTTTDGGAIYWVANTTSGYCADDFASDVDEIYRLREKRTKESQLNASKLEPPILKTLCTPEVRFFYKQPSCGESRRHARKRFIQKLREAA